MNKLMTEKEILAELSTKICVLGFDNPLDNPVFNKIYLICLSEKETLTPLRITEIVDKEVSAFMNLQMELRKIERNSK